MRTFAMRVLTPDGTAFEGASVESARFPGPDGSFGILAGHTPLLACVKNGVVSVRCEGREIRLEVGEGVLKVGDGEALLVVSKAAPL